MTCWHTAAIWFCLLNKSTQVSRPLHIQIIPDPQVGKEELMSDKKRGQKVISAKGESFEEKTRSFPSKRFSSPLLPPASSWSPKTKPLQSHGFHLLTHGFWILFSCWVPIRLLGTLSSILSYLVIGNYWSCFIHFWEIRRPLLTLISVCVCV